MAEAYGLFPVGYCIVAYVLCTICFCAPQTGYLITGKTVFGCFSVLLAGSCVASHIVNNTFSGVLRRGYYKEFVHTVTHVVTAEMAVIVYLFILKQGNYYSRVVIGLVAVFYILISYCVRILWKRFLRKKGNIMDPASLYIITTADVVEKTTKSLQVNASGEYRIQGICLLDEDCVGKVISDIPVTSTMDTVLDFLCDKWIDEVYIALPEQAPIPNYLIDRLTEMGIAVHMELDPAGSESWQIRQVQYVSGKLVQTISMTNVATRSLLAKRTLDIIGGIIGCLITVLLIVILGPLIYIQSPGPIFFSQIRVGKNGKPFKMYKFRSMYPDADAYKTDLMKENRIQDGRMFKMEADPRIIGCKILPDGTVKKRPGQFYQRL